MIRTAIAALPCTSLLVQKILYGCGALDPHPNDYLRVMAKYGTTAEGNLLDKIAVALKLNLRFRSCGAPDPVTMWTVENVAERLAQLEADRGVG